MNNTEMPVLLEAEELKAILGNILNGEKDWNSDDERLLIASMLEHIGSIDSLLRDTHIYGTFCKLILEKRLDEELQKELLDRCLTDEMLFHDIGDAETDSVFTRAFTTLLIALILYSDNESNFLSAETIRDVQRKMLIYLEVEKDLRGFIPGKGWAHSIAHAADAFDELAKNRHTGAKMQMEILNALWVKAFVSESVYIHDEEERLLVPILEMMKRELDIGVLENLLKDLPEKIRQQKQQLEEETYWFLIANAKKFLKSFYIQIENLPELSAFQKSIRDCLTEL